MTQLTIASEPPTGRKRPKSKWEQIFDECREHPDEWRRISETMAESTATQLASDIRSFHRRQKGIRIKGLRENERWSAEWAEIGGEFWLWVRFDRIG